MKFQLEIKDATDLERLKEMLHTHPLKDTGFNPIAGPIFNSREAVDNYWGDYIPTEYPYLFICDVKEAFGAGGFGASPGRQVIKLLPLKGTHSFEQLARIKAILEDKVYLKVCEDLNNRVLTGWEAYHEFDLELQACQRGRSHET